MPSTGSTSPNLRRRQRAVVWGMLCIHGLVVSGLPLPMAGRLDAGSEKRLSAKDRSTPFPCMDKPCGCATAEQCFTNCCCHTPAETLAWAKANRVEPSLLMVLERRLAQAEGPVRRAKKSCCASGQDDEDVCSDYRSLAANPEWQTELDEADRTGDDDREPASRASSRGRAVSMRAMLACGGIVAAWSVLATAVPQPPFEFELALPPAGSIVIGDDVSGSGLAVPDAPPPRA